MRAPPPCSTFVDSVALAAAVDTAAAAAAGAGFDVLAGSTLGASGLTVEPAAV